ncbi:MAG: alpha/beta hydrolase, partial [Chloroflexi bacterium]|nr:alpha/beta hydrolase [Chloroflexota bacterium]
MSEWQSGYVYTNGIRMHYWRTGNGDRPAVVLSHGATDNGLCWTRTAQALEADYDVIMVDARGHGLSDKPESDYGPRQSGNDLAGLIAELALDRPHLVGHSMGGEISSNCVADHPGLARSLVVLDSGFISNNGAYRGSSQNAAERMARSREGVAQMRALGLEGLLARLDAESPNWHELERGPWAESKLQVTPEYGRFFAQDKRPWQEIFAAIDCPMLLMVAEPHLGSHTQWEAAVQATGIW